MNVDKDVFVPEKTFEQSFGEWLDWLTDAEKAALLWPEVSDLGHGSEIMMAASVCVFMALIVFAAAHRTAQPTPVPRNARCSE